MLPSQECRFYYARLSKMPFYCSYKIWLTQNGPNAGSDAYAHVFSSHIGRHGTHGSFILAKKNLDAIISALNVVTPISGPLAPVVASVGLSVMFAKWLSDMYTSTYVPISVKKGWYNIPDPQISR